MIFFCVKISNVVCKYYTTLELIVQMICLLDRISTKGHARRTTDQEMGH